MKGKESVATIHMRLKIMCLVSAVDGNTVSLWALQITGAEKGQSELSDTCRSGGQKQQLLRVASTS